VPNVAFTGAERRFRQLDEVGYRALRLLTLRAEGMGSLKRQLALRRLDKAWGLGRLGYPEDEPTDWKWRMCEARKMLGDYLDWGGWEYRSEWSAGLWHNPEGVWDGSRVDRLWVYGEQGVGDEVCFSQVLLEVKELVGEVVFETEPRLMGLMGRSLGVSVVGAVQEDGLRKFQKPDGPWMALGDLLRYFRNGLEKFPRVPYLKADPEQVERFKGYRGRIGLAWRGAQGSFRLDEFKGLIDSPLGLQYDIGWDEEVETPDGLDLRGDVEGVCGLLMNLERLVTVSTSVAHFAGALGVKTDLILAPMNGVRKNMLPFKWWCEKTPGKTPWYGDHVRVFDSIGEYRVKR
jgi:hypothetical protein